ncbi:hypothetical protein ACFL7D_02470 [candidate division KSB1 bacterium]
MNRKIVFVLAIFVCFRCSFHDEEVTETIPYFSDPVKKVLTVGSEDLPEKYLLDRPSPFHIGDNGDLYIFDEYYIKVFDKDGQPKTIFGGRGEGPGEFTGFSMGMWIAPTGILAVVDNGWRYNLYAPDNSFIAKEDFRQTGTYKKLRDLLGLRTFFTENMVYFSREQRLIEGHQLLAYDDGDSVTTLVHYQGKYLDKIHGTDQILNFNAFQWQALPDYRAVYSHAGHDIIEDVNGTAFALHIVSLETMEEREIVVPYTRTVIPDSVIDKVIVIVMRRDEPNRKKLTDEEKDHVREIKYYSPFYRMIADGNILFIFYGVEQFEGENSAIVVDLDTGKRISRVRFPMRPERIKNGYAYTIDTDQEGFYVIEKYRIDPAVYGK